MVTDPLYRTASYDKKKENTENIFLKKGTEASNSSFHKHLLQF